MTDNWVTIRNLSFKRGDRVIFDNVDLDIRKGHITAILGPSGTGKTTLLRLIGAQLTPSAGTIEVNGVNIHQLSREELYFARRQMGMLFQSGALFTNLTAFENVAFPLREHTRLPESMIRDLVLMKLQAVGLRGARDLATSQLSGGMARRVSLARSIALDPQLIMYDEPFTGLDPVALGVIVQLIKRLNDALGMTSILVSHDVTETTSIADYLYVIADGKVIGQGTPEELQRDITPKVQQFIQGLPDGPVPFHYPAKDYAEDLYL
jgi:phospholipid/cholesterol/gamma-HCH transport system ATP-binding protein